MKSKETIRFWELIAISLCSSLYIILVRYPHARIPWSYHDDAEGLYHAFSMAQGLAPYLQDSTHHFLGYVIPHMLIASFTGYTYDVIRVLWHLCIPCTAVALYVAARSFVSIPSAFTAALIFLTAGQPRTTGFYIQYELNAALSCSLSLLFWYVVKPRKTLLLFSSISMGFLLSCDQRTLVFAPLIPLVALFHPYNTSIVSDAKKRIWLMIHSILCMALIPCLCLIYLWHKDALQEFFFQVYTYPREYRIASQSLSTVLYEGYRSHYFLYQDTFIFLFAALLGLLFLLFHPQKKHTFVKPLLLMLLFLSSIAPFFGGRYYAYYVVTYYPVMMLLTAFGIEHTKSYKTLIGRVYTTLLCLPLLFSLIDTYVILQKPPFLSLSYDGNKEVADYLEQHISDEDTVFVWGYRPDIYLLLQTPAPSRFVNQMMIHPDGNIISKEDRMAHVVPHYLKEFEHWLNHAAPDYIVTFQFSEDDLLTSEADSLLRKQLESQYCEVLTVNGRDASKRETLFNVYKTYESSSSSFKDCMSSPKESNSTGHKKASGDDSGVPPKTIGKDSR